MSKKQSFVKGAAILGFAGLIVKVIGAFFRVPLTNILGSEGIANYQVAYPYYTLLLVVSSAGLPTAISRIVSERVTLGDYRGAHKTFQTALKILFVFGVATTAILFALSGMIANASKIPSAHLSLKMIAPSLFFVSILSAYRGYFQGLQLMSPTALTQIVEQLVKLGAGIFFALQWVGKGVEYGAAGALLGVTISEVIALIVIIIIYNFKKKQINENRRQSAGLMRRAKRSIASELILIAVPITLGACILPIVNSIDTAIVTNTLLNVDYSAFNPLSPQESFGVLTGAVNTLANMPAVLSLALCMSLVPAISEAIANNDTLSVCRRSGMGFKLAFLIGLPCAVGLFLLSEPVLTLLYSRGLKAQEIAVGSTLLKTMSVGVLFLTMLQSMAGILQGAKLQWVPFFSLLIGAGVKLFLSIELIKIPSINVNGAAIGTAACYGIAAIVNIAVVLIRTRARIRIAADLLAPVISAAMMGVVVHFMYRSISQQLSNSITVLACIATAALVYISMLFVTGALKKDDMEFIPGGGRIIRFINRLGFWED